MRIDKVVEPCPLGESQTWAKDQDAADPRKLPGWLNSSSYGLAEFCFDEQGTKKVELRRNGTSSLGAMLSAQSAAVPPRPVPEKDLR